MRRRPDVGATAAHTLSAPLLRVLDPKFLRAVGGSSQVSGIIADLLRNKRSIPYARAWRSDLNMLSITQLMVRLWVAEESRLGVSRPNGVLQNLWEPLQSHDREHGLRDPGSSDARSARSRPSSGGQAGGGLSASTTSGGHPLTAEIRSSLTTLDSSGKTNNTSGDLCSLNGHIGANLLDAANVPDANAASPASPASDAGGTMRRSSADGGADTVADTGVHGGEETHSFAVALALEASKQAVTVGQRRKDSGGGAGRRKRASQAGTDASIAKAMATLDMRGKIAAVLGMVGFNGNAKDGLGPSDLKASYMATSYMDFRAGEAWQRVSFLLRAQSDLSPSYEVNEIARRGRSSLRHTG